MGEAGQHTTQMLLQRIRAGDAHARAALVARVEPLLKRFAHGRLPQLLRHEQDTADLVQLTWLKVLDKLDGIALSAPGDFFSYLRTVLLNALREALRKHGRSRVDVHADGVAAAAELPADNVAPDDWLAYEQALAALPADARVLVLMRFEFGMSFAEIAEEFGETPDAMRMRVNRAIARIAGEPHGVHG
jgi:RNA polymerase sigma-70 factor (ECF subfamily)